MTARVIAGLWLVVGIAVWNGFFDLYVSRGAREYAQLRLEHDLKIGPEPNMNEVMARNTRAGVWASTAWASGIVICGWATMWYARRPRRDH